MRVCMCERFSSFHIDKTYGTNLSTLKKSDDEARREAAYSFYGNKKSSISKWIVVSFFLPSKLLTSVNHHYVWVFHWGETSVTCIVENSFNFSERNLKKHRSDFEVERYKREILNEPSFAIQTNKSQNSIRLHSIKSFREMQELRPRFKRERNLTPAGRRCHRKYKRFQSWAKSF